MGNSISSVTDFFLIPLYRAILYLYDIVPFSRFWTYRVTLTGLIHLVLHRSLLEKLNLYRAPVKPIPPGRESPSAPPRGRPDDGFGTDYKNPTTAMEGAPIGRNMPGLPKHLRDPHGKPEVQLVAQRLLAREGIKPAAQQLNILAASWIQAMVHDWIGHFDGEKTVVLDSNTTDTGATLCPFAKSPFRFKETKQTPDGHFDSERTNWWDASFVYGNNKEELDGARTKAGGKMVVGKNKCTLAERDDGTYLAGDNKNSWVGVTLLQDLFIREHNYVADKLAEEDPTMTDQEIFDKARVVISALVAKIHTIDWTCQLLDTRLLKIGMNTNWDGLLKAFGIPIPGVLSKMGEWPGKTSNNQDTPFCLTEEFAAVYRLHSLSPPGLILGDDKKEFIGLEDLIGDQGREEMRKTPTRGLEMFKSVLYYPCGGLVPSNYPNAYRNFAPTDVQGRNLPKSENIDLAALDLFRDRERGILKFNDFRRQIFLKPYKTWMELTNYNEAEARKLELIYGPGQEGIERLDLLVGDMYEGKVQNEFALSETSFIIFLLMASRRLDADPFLNELYTEEYYGKFGLKHVKKTETLFELLDRHYPELSAPYKNEKGEAKSSVFKPSSYDPKYDEKGLWKIAEEEGIIPERITNDWKTTAKENKEYFDKLEKETEIYTKNLKANPTVYFKPEWTYIAISILLVIVPYYITSTVVNPDISIHPLYPVDLAREFAFSNVRHKDTLNRIWHLITNPLIYISQSYLLDLTPSLFDLSISVPFLLVKGAFIKINFNACGFYFSYLTIYSFTLDFTSGIFHLIYLLVLYYFVPDFGKWVTRLVGPRNTNLVAFIIYLFAQGSQIIYGHLGREDFYDWNFYQLFHIQQLLTVWNIMRMIGVLPFLEELKYWEPIMTECMGKINFEDCGM